MATKVAAKKSGSRKPKPGQLRNANGAPTVEGKVLARQIAFPLMEKLEPRKEVIEAVRGALNLTVHYAEKLYEELEYEFGVEFKKPAKSQLDYARYRALQEIMNGADINASQRLAAAKELGRLIGDDGDGGDDITRCRHYESLWKRIIDATAKMGLNDLQKVYDRIEDLEWDMFQITEHEVISIEEKAEAQKGNVRSRKRGK